MAVRPAPAGWASVEAQPAPAADRAPRPARRVRPHLEPRPASAADRRAAGVARHRRRACSPAAPARLAGRRRLSHDRRAIRTQGRSPATTPPDARAVLLTGVYGTGKTTTAIEVADRLDGLGRGVAAIDLDWLGWYTAPIDWDEHDDPRIGLANLAAMRATYLERRRPLVRPGRDGPDRAHLAGLRAALGDAARRRAPGGAAGGHRGAAGQRPERVPRRRPARGGGRHRGRGRGRAAPRRLDHRRQPGRAGRRGRHPGQARLARPGRSRTPVDSYRRAGT